MKKYSHDRELAAYMANSYINGEEITLKGIGKAVLFGGIYGTIGGILGVTQAPKSAKAVYSAFVGLAEGIRTAKETPGTIIEKSFAGLKNGLITVSSTLFLELLNILFVIPFFRIVLDTPLTTYF